jgi:hypothetical protein
MMFWRTFSGNDALGGGVHAKTQRHKDVEARRGPRRREDGRTYHAGCFTVRYKPGSTPFSPQHELKHMDTPRFKKGETLRLVQYIAPLPRGTQVTVLDVNEKKRGTVYLVEANHRGERIKFWTKENDLGMPFI